MRKLLAIYLAICSTAFLCTSCFDDDEESVITYPFAALKSFSIGSFYVKTKATTSEGKDTVVAKKYSGSFYPFIIDQKSLEVYNPDSLPMGADVTKLTTGVDCDGIAYFYTDSTDTYELISSADSIDLSKPRKLLVASTNGITLQAYTVKVNVHAVDPEVMYWQQLDAAPVSTPQRAVLLSDKILLFGRNGDGAPVVCDYDAVNGWSSIVELTVTGLDVENVQLLAGVLYATDGKSLYSSGNGTDWSVISADASVALLFAATNSGLWAVTTSDSIAYSVDGINFESVQPLDENFPVENISVAQYPLLTNPDIMRTVVVGYPAVENSRPQVWSRLSTENIWAHYKPLGDGAFDCPALRPLSVLHYDNSLYAFGGKGVVADEVVMPFETIYSSPDNGLTWKALAKVKLPEQLRDSDAPFATVADSNGYMWIIVGGENPVVWRGRINRLSF